MTKDGRPSKINDIRYFHGDKSRYLKGHEDAVAFGRRLAWWLNGEAFSLGAYPSLYIYFTESLEPGVIEVTDQGGDWWQRYTNIGVSGDFKDKEDGSKIVMSGTVAALKVIRPDLVDLIIDADNKVKIHGQDLRFLLKTRQTKHFVIEISFNIGTWPRPSFLFVSLTDLSNGNFLEAPPIPMQFYAEAFDLAGAVKVTGASAAVMPNSSVAADLTSERHGGPFIIALSEFLPKKRPIMSKLVKRRG